jgi:histidine triad (HIT) family protein
VISHAPPGYDCPFCRVARGAEEDAVVHRDDDVIVVMNPRWWPKNHGAVLVVPNEHFENVFDLPVHLGTPIQRAVRATAIAMKAAFGCDGVSTRQHNEPGGGQDVWHAHVHVFPRWHDDGLYGATPAWADRQELLEAARNLREHWPQP